MVLLAIAALIFLPILLALSVVLNGYVLCVLWGWFIVPTFGLPRLSIPAALGVALVASVLTYQGHHSDTDEDAAEGRRPAAQKYLSPIFESILRPLVLLLYGYIIHRFM
jgi:hypothetical protein